MILAEGTMSTTFGSFDDDDDDSLLISPTVGRVRGDTNAPDHDHPQTADTAIVVHSTIESPTSATDIAPTDESFTMAKTPQNQKSKFNYASALEELEFLAPTPARVKTERTRIQANCEDEGKSQMESPLIRKFSSPPSPLASSPSPLRGNATTVQSDEIIKSHIDASPLPKIPTTQTSHLTASNTQTHCSGLKSVFRQPCILRTSSTESLNLGRPVNESYDITELNLPSGVGYDEDGGDLFAKDSDLSMEVEKQCANVNYDGLILEECNRFESANIKADEAITSMVKHTSCSENEDEMIDAVVHPTSKVYPAVVDRPWDIMDSEESEEDFVTKNRQSGYVEKMNESIASYFSSYGGTIPPEQNVNTINDSLEFSDDLDCSFEESRVGLLPTRPSMDKEQRRSHFYKVSDEVDGNEHSSDTDKFSVFGDDSTQIGVDQGSVKALCDVDEENRDGSQGFLIGVKSSHEDDSKCEPSVDCSNSIPSASQFQLRTGASNLGDSDSLFAEYIEDPCTLCVGNSESTVPKLTTAYDSDADARTKAQGDVNDSGDDNINNDCITSGNTCAIIDGNNPTLAVDARDGAAHYLLPIDSNLQAEQENSSDAQLGFDFDYSLSGVEEVVLQVPKTKSDHQELSVSNASIGSFSDDLSPIWGSAPSQNSILDNSSPDLRIEIASENLNNFSGEVKLSFDGKEDHQQSITDGCVIAVGESAFQVPFQQPAEEYSNNDQSDFHVRKFDVNKDSARGTENYHIQTHSESDVGTIKNQKMAVRGLENKRVSLEDLSSYQQSFDSTSNAFLERLREGAELRKREVTRGRHSMERKEQILSEEKIVRAQNMTMTAVSEERSKSPALHSIPKTMRQRTQSIDYSSKSNEKVFGHKLLDRDDDNPHRPFKATPLPATSCAITSTVTHGAKRKSSTVFRLIPTQNNINNKSLALNIKPPKRLLSGEDASNAKAMSLRKRIQEEEDKIRRESTFKARPLPVTTRARSFDPLVGEHLVDGKSAQSEKENMAFVPRSSFRAEERKLYDIAKAQREQVRRQDEIEQRNRRIEETKAEIHELKKFLR